MSVRILMGDCRDVLTTLPDESVHCCVTSPPYFGLRDYGVAGQIGLEPTPDAYVAEMVAVFREVRRVLRSDGTCWLNLGDSYAGGGRGGDARPDEKRQGAGRRLGQASQNASMIHRNGLVLAGMKPKDIIGIPWRVAFALQADGWWLRQDIIWSKPNPMPESVTDRCTKAHEYLFLLTKAERYYYDADAIKEPSVIQADGRSKYATPSNRKHANERNDAEGLTSIGFGVSDAGRNKRSVWEVATQPYAAAHFATFPPALIEPCILAGTSEKGCCAKCGAPWVREVEREKNGGWNDKYAAEQNEWQPRKGGIRGARCDGADNPARILSVSWSPSCQCEATVVPCTVLDPFSGAGTTGLVADRLQRNAILIELNPSYSAMAEARVRGDAGLFYEAAE